ncbi:MAG: hypothetical protein AVDCRST_MAG13-1423, partial [uncultured Solirubrobacteraceae bacterium]
MYGPRGRMVNRLHLEGASSREAARRRPVCMNAPMRARPTVLVQAAASAVVLARLARGRRRRGPLR